MAHSIWQNAHLEQLDEGWLKVLQPCLKTPQAEALASFLETQLELQGGVLPLQEHWFKAFKLTPFKQVKVVILGQDPYHGMEQGQPQAHGLSFSVRPGVAVPPSLRNIYKELHDDMGIEHPGHGNLEAWARSGVLLLNSVLTVRAHDAGSHRKQGWEILTDRIIEVVSEKSDPVVFILWGNLARSKASLIASHHHIIESPHPSPLSASRDFFGTKPFSRANDALVESRREPIDWSLPIPDG